jgi:YVTN family beta-propeller protein
MLRRAGTVVPAVAAIASAQQTRPRKAADPGVVTTGQQVTPAGVQSIYDGRVFGVTFGRTSDDLWVLVSPNNAKQPAIMNLSWRDNRVIGSIPITGATLAPQGIRYDRPLSQPVVTYAARMAPRPGAAPAGPAMVQLAAVSDTVRTIAAPLGAMATGAPALARREDAKRRRLAVVPLTFNDSLAIVDVKTGTVVGRAPTGIAPFGAVIDSAGTTAFVTNWGGRRPTARDRTATTGTAATADRVVVDARGIASTGTVTRVDLATLQATHTIDVGLHPTAIVWDEHRHSLYVANGQSDAISVIDAETNRVARTISIAPFRDRTRGLAPTALALSPDGSALYVALGGVNAVAVIDPVRGELHGMIPTGWYPNALAVSDDGQLLAIATLYGIGSGAETAELVAASPSDLATSRRYVHRYRGTVSVVEVPNESALAQYTAAVSVNVQLSLGATAPARLLAPRANATRRAVPDRHGESSPIEHVVYIVKENRTYDQVLGDVPQGNGDSSLAIYGRRVTPNHHRLAEQFVLLDNFYATGGNSGNGHQWVTQANETEYTMWPGYQGRSYPFDGTDPIAYASGGFLWDAVLAKKKTVKIFGEYAGSISSQGRPSRLEMLAGYRAGRDMTAGIHTVAPNHSVDALVARDFPSYGGVVPDVVRAQIFLRHLEEWKRTGTMPNLVLIQLPSDHTGGTQQGYSTPAACVADNDLALGQIVEGLTKSPFWKSMAIFVVEDDAQGGVDHVDGHRTVALAISPYTKRRSVDKTMYAHQSLVKTIELMLGTNPMSVFDLAAPSMSRSFISPEEQPDFTTYAAVEPEQSIYEENPKASRLRGPAREAAFASARMNFAIPDAAPSEKLNRILWHDAKGWNTPYPAVRRSLFFPLAADLADDEREDEKERPAPLRPRRPDDSASARTASHMQRPRP